MEGAALPSVSVVVPVLNGEATIAACLHAILSGDYPTDRRQLLVVDNGSTDRTAEHVGGFPVEYLREPRRGPARARNLGIEGSKGEVIVFTDADCLPSTAWLRELVRPFEESDVGGVAGEILPFPPHTAAERYAARIRHLSPERYLRRPIFPFAVTANLAFRRDVFTTVGVFDTRSPRGGESTDFCTRFFRETGKRLALARKAVVFHRHRSSAAELFRQQWGYGRGHAYLYIKYSDELPWGWRQTGAVYADLARSAAGLAGATARRPLGGSTHEDVEFAYFELLRKVALRLGFAREALSQRRLYL